MSDGSVLFQAAKICNNMLLAIGMIGTSETMNLGIRYKWVIKRNQYSGDIQRWQHGSALSLVDLASIRNCWRRSWTWAQVGAGPVTPITLYPESWKESHLGITTRAASELSSWLRSARCPRLSCFFFFRCKCLTSIKLFFLSLEPPSEVNQW